MFYAQLALSLAVWAVAVALLYRRRDRLYAWAKGRSRGGRAFAAVGALLLSVSLLGLLMAALPHGGILEGRLSALGWLGVTLAGAAFVLLQTAALFPLALNAVTREEPRPSHTQDTDRP